MGRHLSKQQNFSNLDISDFSHGRGFFTILRVLCSRETWFGGMARPWSTFIRIGRLRELAKPNRILHRNDLPRTNCLKMHYWVSASWFHLSCSQNIEDCHQLHKEWVHLWPFVAHTIRRNVQIPRLAISPFVQTI